MLMMAGSRAKRNKIKMQEWQARQIAETQTRTAIGAGKGGQVSQRQRKERAHRRERNRREESDDRQKAVMKKGGQATGTLKLERYNSHAERLPTGEREDRARTR